MNESLLNRILKENKRRTRSLAMILCLSMIVSLGTFAGFHQTAIAKAYTREVLDCPYTHEGAEPVAHVHNDDCYDGETLVCTLPEREAHTHDDTCYAESRLLSCGLEENPGHQHSEECFDENGELICQIPEGEGAHTHTDDCYTIERALICNQPELPVHVHDAGCFRTEEISVDEPEETAASEQAVSAVPEMPVSDPNADLETSDDWNREFENLELSGNWARDLVLVAATQQGRGESPNNFEAVLNDAGDAWVRHGYTRYGAWYGYPYAEWDAMFVSFCLRYAGIPAENAPNNPTAALMAESFSMGELFAGRDYVPAVGDLIFFDTIDDEITNIDHMGIVYHVDAENGTINTVEGDRTDAVATFGYTLDDEQIVGYGMLPQNPNYIPVEGEIEEEIENEFDGFIFMTTDEEEETPAAEEATAPAVPMPAQSWERTAGGIKVTVDALEGAFPENTRIAVTPVNGNSLKDTVSDAVSGEVLEVQAVDITFFDASGREIEPAVPIRVVMTPAATENAEEKTSVVHVDVAQQTAELVEQAVGTEFDNSEVVFDADAFTIYAIVYTYQVEYEYEVDGKTFTSSMPGAENMSLTQIVQGLGIVDETEIETFVSKIASIASSNEEVAIVNENNEIRVLKDGEAKIVITMQDGAKFHIDVRAEGETSASNETATVSTVGELYLPAEAELKTEVLDEVKSESAIAAVEAKEGTTNSNAAVASAYQVFDISLENVPADQYDGFQVEVKLPENVVGRDFRLFHIHDGETTEINLNTVSRPADDTGLEVVSGFTFETQNFSEFVLKYTVDFEYEVDGRVYQFSIPGGDKIALSDLVEELGIIESTSFENTDAFLKEVANVSFSDEHLIAVTKVTEEITFSAIDAQVFDVFAAGGEAPEEDATIVAAPDWVLTSLAPFSSEEMLTISMKNEDQITINVTDDQETNLAEFITDASLEIEGKTYGQGQPWYVREDVGYALKLAFKESGSRQFPQGGEEIVMNLKDLGGMRLEPGQGNTFDIPMGLYGTVTGNTWRIDDAGLLHLKFGPDPDNLLTRSNNAHFNLELDVKFSGSGNKIEFNDRVERDWTANTDTDIKVNKSGHYDSAKGKMVYTVTVTSTGKSTNVTVTDSFANTNLLTLDQGSITISPNKELAESGNSTSASGFTRVIKEIGHNETVTITYTADVNEAALGAGGTVTGDDGKNSVHVETEQKKEDDKTNIVNEIKFSDLSKVTTSSEDTEDGTIEMNWKITANEGKKASLVGSTISDKIDWNSKDIMKYATSDGKVTLTIVGKDANDHEYSNTVQVNVNDNQGQESWAWVVESLGEPAGTPLTYEISYHTTVTKQAQNTSVKNDATNDAGGSQTGTGVVPGTNPGGGGGQPEPFVTDKIAKTVTSEYVDWDIVINVPAEGFPDGLTIYDEIPWQYKSDNPPSNTDFRDTFVEIVDVTGIDKTKESYTQNLIKCYGDETPAGFDKLYLTRDGEPLRREILTIKFYKTEENGNTSEGLLPGSRTVTVTIRTKNDERWMDWAAEGHDYYNKHTNNARINEIKKSSDAFPVKPTIKKTTLKLDKNPPDGLPIGRYYYYDIQVSNVTADTIDIDDIFNTSILEFVDISNYVYAWKDAYYVGAGVHDYDNITSDHNIPTYTTTDEGVHIHVENLLKQVDGSNYPFYHLRYYLRVKDENALKQQAIANGGKYTLHNTAVWGDLSDDFDVDYEVTAVNKEGYFASNNAEERKFTFVIDANPSRFKLGSDGTVELTDQHTDNLSVDYSSVKIYKIPEGVTVSDAKSAVQSNQTTGWELQTGEAVQWNFNGNEGTFYLNDETHYVIVYDAIVIGSGYQKFSNVADLNGFISSKEGEKTYSNDQSAGGEIWEIKLLKYKDGLTSHGLQGATFQLFRGTGEYVQVSDDEGNTWWEEEKEPMKYGDTPTTRANGTVGANITFTTGSDGTVNIQVDQVRDGNEIEGGVHYFLKEIDSPSGYQIDSSTEYWAFTLTNDPDEVNYGDPNRPDEYGNRQWVYFYYNDILKMANTETHEPLDVVVNKTWYDKDGYKITGENLDTTFVATVQLLRKTDDGDYVPVKVEYGTDGKPSSITEVSESTSDSQIQLTNENDWSYTWSQLPRVEMGGDKGLEVIHRYAYKIEEVSVNGYVVSLTESETKTVKTYALKNYATPDNKTTDITVNKNWQDSDGTTIEGTADKLPGEIQFKLYRAVSTTPFTRVPSTGGSLYVIAGDDRLVNQTATEGTDDYGVYKLTKTDSWQTTFADLPETETTDGTTYYYAYYVKEVPMSGYTTTYTSNGTTRTITNREPLPKGKYISIGLEKKWTDGTNTTPPSGASATFTVHQQKSTVSGTQGTILVRIVNDDLTTVVSSLMASAGDQLRLDFTSKNSWDNSNVSVKNSSGGWKYKANVSAGNYTYQVASEDIVDGSITFKFDSAGFVDGCPVKPFFTNTTTAAPTYSEYEDTTWTKSVTLPTTAGAWSTTIKDLIQEDDEGNLYRYYITEDSCTPTATTVAFKDKDGNDIKDNKTEDGVNQTTASLNATGQKVEVTNTYKNEMGAVKVTKSFSGVDSLPTGFQISNSYNDTVFTVGSENMTGTGSATDPYVWILDNVPVGTEVTFTESGATVDGATLTITANGTAVAEGSNTATANATSAKVETGGEYPTATFVNEYEQTTDFEFSKIWKNIGNQSTTWPTGATITVTMNAYTDTSQKAIDDVQVTLSADGSAAGVTPAWTATTSAEGTVTTFKVKGLPKYKDGIELHYYVIETQVTDYKEPSYADKDGNGLINVGKATNGQQIINTPEGGYELPSTGGPGTRLFTILSSILILGAGVLMWRKRRTI